MKRRDFIRSTLAVMAGSTLTVRAVYFLSGKRIDLSEIVARTLRSRDKQIADNITSHNALLRHLEKRK